MPFSYNTGDMEDPDGEDVYGVLIIVSQTDGSTKHVKVLVNDHIEKGKVEHIRATDLTDVDLYLTVSRAMVAELNDLGYGPLLQRALTLTAMELLPGGTNEGA